VLFTVPWISKVFPTESDTRLGKGMKAMTLESQRIIKARREDIAAAQEGGKTGRDLLSLMIKANEADDNAKNRMTDEELMGQMTTFLLAGHETTSTALTWTLYLMSLNPSVQSTLRSEILAWRSTNIDTDPSADDLNNFPYLDAVCREVLRFSPPVSNTVRQLDSKEGDMIPLSNPIKLRPPALWPISWLFRNTGSAVGGRTTDHIYVKDKQVVFLSILAYNKSKAIWGEDAEEFKPERWLDSSKEGGDHIHAEEGENHRAGVWAGLLTFLGGPRSCIGYRFAILELKALLFVLLGEFEFELREPNLEIEARSTLVTRPRVKGEEGAKMPLRVKKYEGDSA